MGQDKSRRKSGIAQDMQDKINYSCLRRSGDMIVYDTFLHPELLQFARNRKLNPCPEASE